MRICYKGRSRLTEHNVDIPVVILYYSKDHRNTTVKYHDSPVILNCAFINNRSPAIFKDLHTKLCLIMCRPRVLKFIQRGQGIAWNHRIEGEKLDSGLY